jgi:4'-phosphopantetheinyl transferase
MTTNWPAWDRSRLLPLDEVHVFAVPLSEAIRSDDELRSIISADERQRADRFEFDRPRRQFIMTRAALRMLLGQMLNVPPVEVELIVYSQAKPRLGSPHEQSNLRFNVAHSCDLGLIAIAVACDVGIDVEAVREVTHLEPIARRHFHPAESAAIDALPPEQRTKAFLNCWTGKEAAVKSVGMGVAESLSQFCVPLAESDGAWIQTPQQNGWQSARVWLQRLVPGDEYVAAVACVGEQRMSRCFTFCW